VREKAFEFGVKLGGERFVVRNDQRGFVDVPDNVCDGESLAGTGDAEEDLVPGSGRNSFSQLRNGLRLIAGGFVGATRSNMDYQTTARAASRQIQDDLNGKRQDNFGF
jgi:hypothetical protein